MRRLLYVAAHGGFARQPVPLGGGAAICDNLIAEWERTQPFDVTLISPAILSTQAPSGTDLTGYSERQYARFCLDFGHAATEEVLRHDPKESAVLINDISEAPDFGRLNRAGFRLHTIYHVDVVAYVANMYLRGVVAPPRLTRWWEAVRGLPVWPEILKLVFEKQRASVEFSQSILVPSSGMKRLLLECYPGTPPGRIAVVPWGVIAPPSPPPEARQALREEFGIPPHAPVVLALSRISPEKGQDRLLEALRLWEHRPDYPIQPVTLLLCGGAAYMQGKRYLRKLEHLAAKLTRTRVVFAGHVTGARKHAMFQAADLYVFASRHESYGLTLLEALSAGLPVVSSDSDGAREVMRDDVGVVVPGGDPAGLMTAIRSVLTNAPRLRTMGAAARDYASRMPFSTAAAEVARLCQTA